MISIPAHTLHDGTRIPALGLGTWPMDDAEAERAVAAALGGGYRLLGTATNYRNETGAGRGVAAADVPREEILVTTKLGDVLKSWSIPKGPSDVPKDKRLAVPTEDHPLEYEDFEGVIPEGEYGGGTVIVWDRGTYEPLSQDRQGRPVDFAESLERGHATFRLHGTKLRGRYALTRFREDNWLLVKTAEGRSRGHGTPNPRRARSVRTGRTLAQVAAEEN